MLVTLASSRIINRRHNADLGSIVWMPKNRQKIDNIQNGDRVVFPLIEERTPRSLLIIVTLYDRHCECWQFLKVFCSSKPRVSCPLQFSLYSVAARDELYFFYSAALCYAKFVNYYIYFIYKFSILNRCVHASTSNNKWASSSARARKIENGR